MMRVLLITPRWSAVHSFIRSLKLRLCILGPHGAIEMCYYYYYYYYYNCKTTVDKTQLQVLDREY